MGMLKTGNRFACQSIKGYGFKAQHRGSKLLHNIWMFPFYFWKTYVMLCDVSSKSWCQESWDVIKCVHKTSKSSTKIWRQFQHIDLCKNAILQNQIIAFIYYSTYCAKYKFSHSLTQNAILQFINAICATFFKDSGQIVEWRMAIF
jgi:hypothetical protein